MKPFSIASLNLHHFKDWEERLPKILELLKTTNPDIFLTQEIQLDPYFDSRNQLEILNSQLHYPYLLFSKAETRTKQKGKDLLFPVEHGLGVLSRYPVNEVVAHELEQDIGDKEKRIAVTYTFRINGKDCKVTNVHFSARNDWALSHFKQVLKVMQPESHIIIGDFNIHGIDFEKNRDLYQSRYASSYDHKKYISFPSQQATFDYALISSAFQYKDVVCREEDVSDHRMLIIEITKKLQMKMAMEGSK